MIEIISTSFSDLTTKAFRSVLLKSILLTIVLFVVALFALPTLATAIPYSPFEGSAIVFGWLTAIVLIVLGGYIIVPVTAIFAGLFLDEIADVVEGRHYSHKQKGIALPLTSALWLAFKFTMIVVIANLLLLPTLFLGIGFILFYLLNAYLLGREYFELAALRHHSLENVRILRKANRFEIYSMGLVIAFLATIPFLNLLTPIFGTSVMVHVYHEAHDRMVA